jgi:hypothetical protein
LGFETMAHGLTADLVFSGKDGALGGKYQFAKRLGSLHLHGFLFLEVNDSARRTWLGNVDPQEFSRIAREPLAKFCECFEIGHVSILDSRECGMGDTGF